MRRTPAVLLLSSLLTPVVVALPTVAPSAAPAPVAAKVAEIAVPVATGLVRASATGAPGMLGHLPQQDTAPFSTVGVTWAADPDVGEVGVEVRTRSAGRWSDWTALDTDPDHGPDASSPDVRAGVRGGSAPMWTGRSDGVEVRVLGGTGEAPRDVEVALVDPGTGAGDAAPGTSSGGVAHAGTPAPEIVTRAQWGADERDNTCSTAYSPSAKVGFVHHTAGRNDYSAEESAAVVRAVYAFHTRSRGWCDVGYNFLVDRWGRIFEGRAGGTDRTVVGAHTGGFNASSFSGSLLGTFDTAVPPQAMLDGLQRLFAWKLGLDHRDPHGTQTLTSAGGGTSRFPAGQVVRFAVVSGHRDAGETSCPGQQTYARLGEVRDRVAEQLGAGFVDPAVAVTHTTPSTPGSATLTGGVLRPTTWTAVVTSPAGVPVRTLWGTTTGAFTRTWDLRDDAGTPVPEGDYRLRLTGSGGEVPWESVVPVGQAPTGVVDEATGTPGPVTSELRVRGWALDRDSAAPVPVRLYLDGVRVGETTADRERPDIAAAFPGYGAAHGFVLTVTGTNGQHRLVTRAVDGRGETQIDARTVVLGQPPEPPLGALDGLARVPGGLRVVGWADDPQADATTTVDVLVDGRPAAGLPADQPRSTGGGFDGVVPVAAGTHTVCVTGRLVGRADGAAGLGCLPARVLPGNAPTGVLDVAANAGDVQGVRVAGWALDPDTAGSTRVHLYVDGVLRDLRADRVRPDIAGAFPGYGDAHGWGATVATGLGSHSVCAYSLNAGPGTTHTALGCRTVQVRVAPFGSLDQVARTGDGRVRVRGWAADPNTPTSPTGVHVYVGSTGHSLAADGSRPDVGRAVPGFGDRHGFDHLVPVPAGPAQVCAFAVNRGPGSHTLLGCRTV